MQDNDFKTIDSTARFSNFQVLNPDFTRCKCNVMYVGRNRNRSDITQEALDKFIERKGYANIPVIGHIRNGQNGNYMGSHDRKIEISNEGIKEINECVAYGVVPVDANPRFEKIIGNDGIEKDYFTLDLILWSHYFPEIMETKYSDEIYFNQSMEISINSAEVDKDNYLVIHDFSMQGLCLLGKSSNKDENSEPCFEDSMVKRFSIDENQFNQNFNLMLEKLKQYETVGISTVQDKKETNPLTKGEIKMDLTKFTTLLSEIKYGEDCVKYSLLGADEDNIFVLDREDNYRVYAVGYAEVDDNIVINWDEKTEGNITYAEKSENEEKSNMSIVYEEISNKLAGEYDLKLEEKIAEISNDAETRFSEMKEKYSDLQNSYLVVKEKLEVFESAEAERLKAEHISAVKETLERFEKKIGTTPEFVYFKAKLDYENVDLVDMEKQLTLMTGDILMKSGDKKKVFSYSPTSTKVKTFATNNTISERYGNLFD